MSARQILRDAGPTWLAGMAISTPLIALLQGALLLQDYRSNHSHAPRPDMPARGVVVVGPSNNNNATTTTTTTTTTNMDSSLHYMATSTTNTTTTYSTTTASVGSILYPRIVKPPAREEPPLRLLVIGDSLAAGVGMSRSGTPALPEAIARGLSQAAGGRAVYWTCVGTPGRTATEIVREIRHLDDVVDKNNTESNKNNTDSNNTTLTDQATGTMLPEKLRAWQAESRWKASERLRLTKLRTQRWLQHRKQSAVVQEEEAAVVAAENAAAAKRIAQWWTRKVAEIRRDVQEFKQIASLKDDDEYNEINEDDSDDIDKPRARQEYTPPPRTLDPELVGEYDIAIVLTGLNDLKDSFLPFMMSAQRLKKLEEARQESGSLGLKDELMRVVHALKSRMNLLIPPVGDKGAATPSSALKSSIEHVDASSSDTTIETLEESKEKHGSAVVVFPALPFSPSSFSQLAPLSWFLTPLVRMMDSNKRNLADMYPDTVVYVETPSPAFFSQAEAKKGPKWEDVDSRKERVLLKLTDISHNVRERVEETMRQHYKAWVLDAEEEEEGYYDIVADSVIHSHDHPSNRYPGATLLACDGVHPNDIGYELWGRYIALQITKTQIAKEEKYSNSS